MAQVMHIDYEAEMREIADFRANEVKGYIGHLLALKIGGKDLKADFNFRDPTAPATAVPMAGAVTLVRWGTGEGDPLTIIGRVTGNNQAIIKATLMGSETTRQVEFKFDMYKHKEGTEFFKTFHTDGKMIKGVLVKKDCDVTVRSMQDYTQITNYEFTLVIEGERAVKQTLESDLGGGEKRSLQFGNLAPN